MAKSRVSSKQRLDLVKAALADLNTMTGEATGIEVDDLREFAEKVESALFDKMVAKSAENGNE